MNEVLCENISDGLLACYLEKDNSSGLQAFASKITSANESLLLDENIILKLRANPGGSLLPQYLTALLTTAWLRSEKVHAADSDSQILKKERKLANDFFAKVFLKSMEEITAGNIVDDTSVYEFLFEHIDQLSENAACKNIYIYVTTNSSLLLICYAHMTLQCRFDCSKPYPKLNFQER